MSDKTISTAKTQERVIRVFVSSTFRDMHAEREELVKHVFPQLRKLCNERGVTWGEVDLRWGITDEEKAEGKVLPICLAEIHRSRPYFIGLLGERYGWVPDEIPEELIEQEAWLKEHKDLSVTELEIIHGVLNNPEMAEHSFFYLRDPSYIESLPSSERADFTVEDADCAEKLRKLKERIEESRFPVRKDYTGPKAFGEQVLKDMTGVIDKLYPKGSEPDPLDREAAEHEAFAQSRARVYIGRKEYFDRLDEHVKCDDQPLVVLGESGSGKSALLANWVLKYREEDPNCFVLVHFIGSTQKSADYTDILLRVMGEIKRRYDLPNDIPSTPEKLREEFPNWLSMAAVRGRFVLVLDALNQLEDRDNAPDLVWLPEYFPPEIRVIVSTLPSRSLEVLNKRNWPTYQIKLLGPKEREELIEEHLKQYTKRLSPELSRRIADAGQTANPLYLKVLLEELRLFGRHEELTKRIEHYLEANNIADLYKKVLERYEEDYERDRPGLVRDVMVLLWAARRGLSEVELMGLLGADAGPLARVYWSPLYLAAEESLVIRSGLIGFSHEYFRKAVEDKYLPTEEERDTTHLRLADYFDTNEIDARMVDELPWQLKEAREWQRLYGLLSVLPFLESAWKADQFEVKAYWSLIEERSDLQMIDAYKPLIDSPGEHLNYICYVAILLGDTGHPEEAFLLRGHLVDPCRKSGFKDALQSMLDDQALILKSWGRLEEAMELHKEQERICHELGNKDGLKRTLGNQANILYAWGRGEEAMELHKQSERICRELGNKNGLSASLGNQATILGDWGRGEEAMELHKQSERICRELGNKKGLSESLGNQATVLQSWDRLEEAMELHKEQERICRELGDKNVLSISLGNQATILYGWGRGEEAMELHKQSERICRELGNKYMLSASLGNQALILNSWSRLEEAMELHKQSERICRELGNKKSLSASLGNQALILDSWSRLEEAMELHKEEERICRELGNKKGLSESLGKQATILYGWGRVEEAMELFKEVEFIFRELGNKDGLSNLLCIQALILKSWGRLEEAMELHKEEEHICRELRTKNSLAACLRNQAILLNDSRKDRQVARIKCEEALGIFKSLKNQLDINNTRTTLIQIRLRLTTKMWRYLFVLLTLLFSGLGVVLGLWKPWLWLIGGPIAFLSFGILVSKLVLLISPRTLGFVNKLYLKIINNLHNH